MSESSIERVDEIPIIFISLKRWASKSASIDSGSRMATGKD